jgi:hypothetical protein
MSKIARRLIVREQCGNIVRGKAAGPESICNSRRLGVSFYEAINTGHDEISEARDV